jgi:hypothetical protein
VREKIKVPLYHFSPAFFSCLCMICVANKKMFSVYHIGRAYKSAIPRGRLKCFAVFATGNVVLRTPGV